MSTHLESRLVHVGWRNSLKSSQTLSFSVDLREHYMYSQVGPIRDYGRALSWSYVLVWCSIGELWIDFQGRRHLAADVIFLRTDRVLRRSGLTVYPCLLGTPLPHKQRSFVLSWRKTVKGLFAL